MDSKKFIAQLANSIGEDQHRVASMIEHFADVLQASATTMTSVAIPSFGTFVPKKYDEEVVTDRSTGKRMLLPPQITIEFQPAAMLRKRLTNSE